MKITKTSLDSRDYFEKLSLPMVIIKRKINNEFKYTGFVPGFDGEDVIEDELEKCKDALYKRTKERVVKMIKANSPFPFFPTKEELLEDFDDIVYITFTKVENYKK